MRMIEGYVKPISSSNLHKEAQTKIYKTNVFVKLEHQNQKVAETIFLNTLVDHKKPLHLVVEFEIDLKLSQVKC